MQDNLINNKIIAVFISLLMGFSPTIIAQNKTSYQLHRGVIIDALNHDFFIINPNNGMDAISGKTGKSIWHSNKADLPLQIVGNQVYAKTATDKMGEITLLMLNQMDGKITHKQTLSLPQKISTNINDGIYSRFKLSANSPTSENIQWQYQPLISQALNINPNRQEFQKKQPSYGEIIINQTNSLNNIQVNNLNYDKASKAAIIQTGKFLPNLKGRQFKDVSGQFILVSQLKPHAGLWNKYSWEIYNINGDFKGQMSHHVSFRPFVIYNNLIAFVDMPYTKTIDKNFKEFPLALEVYSLNSGQLLWRKEVRNLKFQGEHPQ